MTRTKRIRPTAAVVGVVIGVVLLAGCGAGQVTQTSRQVTAVDGANTTVGTIAIRNAQFAFTGDVEGPAVYARGASAPLEMTIVNTGGTGDELVSVSSPIASTVEIGGVKEVPAGQTLVVSGTPAPAVAGLGAEQGAEQGAQPSGEPAAEPSGEPAAAPTTASVSPATGEAGSSRTAQVVFGNLRDDIRSGLTYQVVLTFRQAGQVSVSVPVAGSTAPREDKHAE